MDLSFDERFKKFLAELKSEVSSASVSTDPADIVMHSVDASKEQGFASAVVSPATQEEAIATVRIAGKHKIPIFTRGAASGMVGSFVPTEPGIVLNFTRLNRIIKIDRDNLTAVVESGVVTGDLQAEVEKVGLFYPPDPGSSAFCTIGGNVAENAGGMRVVKYGSTTNYILALKCVIPTGEVFTTGAYTTMNVAGYDLVRLIVGSEGTLAVVLEITVRLIPKPVSIRTAFAQFATELGALSASAEIIKAGLVPRSLEFMGEEALNCVRKGRELPLLLSECRSALLLESDGIHPEATRTEISEMKSVCERFNLLDWKEAEQASEREVLWDVRKSMAPTLFQVASYRLEQDVALPRAQVAKFVDRLRAMVKEPVPQPVIYGHLGHGNLHVSFLVDGKNDPRIPAIKEMLPELFRTVVEMGGSIAAEHGIGIQKRNFLPLQLSETEIRLEKAIKKVFDPDGILNPGKIFPD